MAKKLKLTNGGDEDSKKQAESLIDKLNSIRPETACFLDGGNAPSVVHNWISTDSLALDIAISNKADGGIPVGRLTEISGDESTGKSLLCYSIIKNTQKRGGIAVLIDAEQTASLETMEVCGVKINELVYIQPTSIEDVFVNIEGIFSHIVESKNESRKDALVTVIWDSIAATPSRAEIEGEVGDKQIATSALAIGGGMRRIVPHIGRNNVCLVFTNQMRLKIGSFYGDPNVTPGGKAIPFYASTRIRLSNHGNIKNGDVIIGKGIRAKCFKNKVAPPHREAEFHIKWDKGTGAYIDDFEGWLTLAERAKVVLKTGSWYSIQIEEGSKPYKFQSTQWSKLLQDESIREFIRNGIVEALIIKHEED